MSEEIHNHLPYQNQSKTDKINEKEIFQPPTQNQFEISKATEKSFSQQQNPSKPSSSAEKTLHQQLNQPKTDKVISSIIDFIFAKDHRKWLLLIFLLSLVLRVLIGIRVPFNADEMVHGTHAIGFIDSGKLQIMDQDPLWFWLTDFSMKILGFNVLGIRFMSVLFGALSVLAIYLLGKEIFNGKTGMVAAFIFATSAYQLVETRAEMDIAMVFFVLCAMYFLVVFFKTSQKKMFILGWVSLGIAMMIKQIAVVFILPLMLFSLYYSKKYEKEFRFKQIAQAAAILLILSIPVLTFNYLLYKDKGIVDLQFARFTKISFGTYQAIGATAQPFQVKSLFVPTGGLSPGLIEGLRMFNRETPIILLLSVIGLFFLFASKNKFTGLLLFSFLTIFIFLSGTSLLSTHFVWGSSYIALLSALAIVKISEKFKKEQHAKACMYLIIIIIAIFAIIEISSAPAYGFFGKNELGKMIDYKEQAINPNALVVADSRIYRGRIVFMFWDKHYLEANFFPQLLQEMEKMPGDPVPTDTYFIQCIPTDCGWGTVKDQPEFNASMENIVAFFKSKAGPVATINDIEGNPYFHVYKQTFPLKPGVLEVADSTHDWFYYPVAYKPASKIFDNYQTHNALSRFLDRFAHLILYAELVLVLLLAGLAGYLAFKKS